MVTIMMCIYTVALWINSRLLPQEALDMLAQRHRLVHAHVTIVVDLLVFVVQ